MRKPGPGQQDDAYRKGAEFLKSIGFESVAEVSRILDVAMNPNSLYLSFRDRKRAVNGSVRPNNPPGGCDLGSNFTLAVSILT